MRIAVFPHDLQIGGSQLNAIEMAAATAKLGHEVVVFGHPGVLVDRIAGLGLEFVPAPPPHLRPTPAIVRSLRRLVRSRRIDVVHAFEWPPIVEARLAVLGADGVTAVGTVMSMAVAPFIPRQMPLVVGTPQIAELERRAGRDFVETIEPPVDTDRNGPDHAELGVPIRRRYGISESATLVVTVSRLAPTLKLEGLLCAVQTLHRTADDTVVLVVGDGPAMPEVAAVTAEANARAGRTAVILTGQLEDPRPAYAAADIVLGMGGSALHAMAFGKPLVVQGECGFWRRLGPESVEHFLWYGWYGVGARPGDGPEALRREIAPLVGDASLRRELGAYGRCLAVSKFSLASAAQRQVAFYQEAVARRPLRSMDLRHDFPAGGRLLGHTLRREIDKRTGGRSIEDFNARPVAATGLGGGRYPHA